MASRYEVKLNNISMASLDSSIVIHDVQYEVPQYSRNFTPIVNRQGSRPGNAKKDRAAVTVTFEIRKYGTADRQNVLTNIINWAKYGGDLTINDRTNQKLVCICDELPAIGSVKEWTGELSITFAAYSIPYWQKTSSNNIVISYSKEETTTKADIFQQKTMPSVSGDAPYIYPEMILINNFSYPQGGGTAYLEIENASRSDGVFNVSAQLSSASHQEIKMQYDENLIMKFTYTAGSIAHDLQGRMTGIDDFKISTGQSNTINFAFYMWHVDGNTGNVVYTPIPCSAIITYRGWWE